MKARSVVAGMRYELVEKTPRKVSWGRPYADTASAFGLLHRGLSIQDQMPCLPLAYICASRR
jgi:hypothetical protein